MPGFVSTLLNHMYSAPGRFVQVLLQVTLQVWHPMHLSKFMTMAICALIFKPVNLLHLTDRNIDIPLVSDRSVIVEAIAELGVAAYHLRWLNVNSRRRIVASAAFFRNLGAWN